MESLLRIIKEDNRFTSQISNPNAIVFSMDKAHMSQTVESTVAEPIKMIGGGDKVFIVTRMGIESIDITAELNMEDIKVVADALASDQFTRILMLFINNEASGSPEDLTVIAGEASRVLCGLNGYRPSMAWASRGPSPRHRTPIEARSGARNPFEGRGRVSPATMFGEPSRPMHARSEGWLRVALNPELLNLSVKEAWGLEAASIGCTNEAVIMTVTSIVKVTMDTVIGDIFGDREHLMKLMHDNSLTVIMSHPLSGCDDATLERTWSELIRGI